MNARLEAAIRRRRRNERGFAATIVAAMLATGVFMGFAAIAVDTGRWYVEIQRVQKAADAAALAGVPYLPHDLPSAIARAKAVAARNGFNDASPDVTVSVTKGTLESQLRVTIQSRIPNVFGASIGVSTALIVQTAMADFRGPQPMGSPCNTFGNEPTSGTGTSATPVGSARGSTPFPNCSSNPQMWSTIEGPETKKTQGDRYQTKTCANSNHGCTSGLNTEYNETGYFYLIKVAAPAVNHPIDLQLYDPAYVETGQFCDGLPNEGSLDDDMNPFVTTDGKQRYGKGTSAVQPVSPTGSTYCPGDSNPDGGSDSQMTTTFVVREQTDTQDPIQGAPITGCTRQYTGVTKAPKYKDLKSTESQYDQQLAQLFHTWSSLCTFTPTRTGDYYLQVRTNVAPAGGSLPNSNGNPSIIRTGNSTATAVTGNTSSGKGSNSYAIRARTAAGLETSVSVAAFQRMPIFANAAGAASTFNLIRVLPGAAGQFIEFSFFDVGDAGSTGSVSAVLPGDARSATTGSPFTSGTSFPGGCRSVGGAAGPTEINLGPVDCTAPISSATNNGQLQKMVIPIPATYTCDDSNFGGCWYQVTVRFPPGTSVHDVTTWDAAIVGDPIRLVE